MSGLGRALFSEPHQNILINELADELARADVQRLTAAIHDETASAEPVWTKDEAYRIAGFYQQVVLNGNPLTKTFAILVALYLSEDVRRKVCASTSVLIARPYFEKFEERIHFYLCGNKSHSALLPLEIVLREWQLYTKLCTK